MRATDITRHRREAYAQIRGARLLRASAALALVVALGIALGLGLGLAVSAASLLAFLGDLPDASALARLPETFTPSTATTRVIAWETSPTAATPVTLDVIHDPRLETGGWQPLDHFAPALLDATIAVEDPDFRAAPSPSLRRALADLRRDGAIDEPVSPLLAALVTDQLRGAAATSGDQRRALQDWLLGWQAARSLSKDEILEATLNTRYYGHLAYGAPAAARVYFGKEAADLTPAEAALLAALGRDPAASPFDDLSAARLVRNDVLKAMATQGLLAEEEAGRAAAESLSLAPPPGSQSRAPEFIRLLRRELETRLGPERLVAGGLVVESTLDPALQAQADCARAAAAGDESPPAGRPACPAADLMPAGATAESAIAVIDPGTGNIRALAGPALEPQATGTMARPFIYLTALSQGYNAASPTLDLPPAEATAAPEAEHWLGPLRLREALAADRAAPARQVLGWVGEARTLATARALGLTWEVGAGESLADEAPSATPLDLTAAFATLANLGVQAAGSTRTIQRVTDATGQIVYEQEAAGRDIVTPGLAYLLNDILSDAEARCVAGCPAAASLLERPVALFAGRSSAGDGWTVGYTPDIAIGVWSEGEPATEVVMPLWSGLMAAAIRAGGAGAEGWPRPAGVREMEVCVLSGLLPVQPGEGAGRCPTVRELFMAGTEPMAVDRSTVEVVVNRETGRLATQFTPPRLLETRKYTLYPPEAADWAEANGIEQPPTEYDTLRRVTTKIEGRAAITSPRPFSTVNGEVAVRGIATGSGFTAYRLAYFPGLLPEAMVSLFERERPQDEPGILGSWDTSGLNGLYTLLLTVFREDGTFDEIAVPVTVGGE